MSISAIVITKNEEEKIIDCLRGLSWCDEIVVVDDNSEDKTRVLAKKFGARVFRHEMVDFASQRNFGLKRAKGEWALFVDADEVVTPELALEIRVVAKNSQTSGYLIKRQDIFMGKEMHGGEWADKYLLRFARGGAWKRKVHEKWQVGGRITKLHAPLLHSPSPSLKNFIDKINKYSLLHAQSNSEEGKKASLIKIVFMPMAKFFYNFIVKRGYKDGVYGFVYSALMSFHSFLAWSKLWAKEQPK